MKFGLNLVWKEDLLASVYCIPKMTFRIKDQNKMPEWLEVRESTYTAALLTTNGNRLLCPILDAKH